MRLSGIGLLHTSAGAFIKLPVFLALWILVLPLVLSLLFDFYPYFWGLKFSILNTYRDDFACYGSRMDVSRMQEVFDRLGSAVGKKSDMLSCQKVNEPQ